MAALERFDKEDIWLAATLSGKHWLSAGDLKGGGKRRWASWPSSIGGLLRKMDGRILFRQYVTVHARCAHVEVMAEYHLGGSEP